MTSSRIVVMSVMSSDALVAKGLAVAFQPRLGFLPSRPDAQFDDAMPRGSARLAGTSAQTWSYLNPTWVCREHDVIPFQVLTSTQVSA